MNNKITQQNPESPENRRERENSLSLERHPSSPQDSAPKWGWERALLSPFREFLSLPDVMASKQRDYDQEKGKA